MNAGKAVYGILSANTGVTDIVGTRIFPEIAEQEAVTPFVIYQLQSVAPEDTHDGPSKLDEVRFEFLCYADSYNEAADLGVAVRSALDRVSGTYNGVNVESVQFNDVDVDIEYDPRRYSQVLKFTFRIKRDDIEIALGTPVTGAVLDDLSDVKIVGTPAQGDALVYQSGFWSRGTAGASTLDELDDVHVGVPSAGQLLAYGQDTWETIDQDEIALPIGSVTGLQGELDSKAESLNDLSDVTIAGTPTGNQALIYDTATSSFKSTDSFTNRFEDDVERGSGNITPFVERAYGVKSDGDGIFIDNQSDTPSAGKVIKRKIYHKAGIITDTDVIGDYTLIHTFDDDTAYSATESTFEGFRDGDTYGTPPYTLIQTWEEEDAAPAFTGLLNEAYGSGAEAAYSVRRLNGNYTGSAIEVERSSDNGTQDIGFDVNGDLDESALETFCTGTTCRVRTWYDQSQTGGTGSGNDAVQTTHANQPTIYTGGAIVKENGMVSTLWSGNQRLTNETYASAEVSDITVATVASINTPVYRDIIVDSLFASNDFDTGIQGGFRFLEKNGTGTPFSDVRYLLFGARNRTNNTTFGHVDGVQVANTSAGTRGSIDGISIGQLGGYPNTASSSFNYEGHISELLLYTSDKSTDRTDIESNIGDYFTQNTPLLDTYTGAAAAYSLRKLRTAYTGSAIRVRRSNDNAETDIGFNVFGELDTVSLAAHCGSNDGFVKTWYDQASSNDASQTTAANQPKIYDGSTGVVTENGKPAVDFDGTNDFLDSTGLSETTLTTFHVARPNQTNSQDALFSLVGSEANGFFRYSSTGKMTAAFNGGFSTTTSYAAAQNLVYALFGTSLAIGYNGATAETASATGRTSTGVRIGVKSGDYFTGKTQELVLYPSDNTSNRTNIEDNINTFYDIY